MEPMIDLRTPLLILGVGLLALGIGGAVAAILQLAKLRHRR